MINSSADHDGEWEGDGDGRLGADKSGQENGGTESQEIREGHDERIEKNLKDARSSGATIRQGHYFCSYYSIVFRFELS